MGPAGLVGLVVTVFAESSAWMTVFTDVLGSVVIVETDGSVLTIFPLVDFSALGVFLTLANFSALVALGHLLAMWSVKLQ